MKGMQDKTVGVTEFKARFPAILKELGKRGGTITITKRGRPLATVRPARRGRPWKSPEGIWAGRTNLPTDPVDLTHLWEVLRSEPGATD